MNYTVKKAAEEGQSEFDTVIEISELTSDVTINALLDHLESTQRVMKESLAQIDVNEALNTKAEEELPILAEVPKDKLALALSYFGKLAANKQAEDLIATCEETIRTYERHLLNIEEATGIKCTQERNPFDPTPKIHLPVAVEIEPEEPLTTSVTEVDEAVGELVPEEVLKNGLVGSVDEITTDAIEPEQPDDNFADLDKETK